VHHQTDTPITKAVLPASHSLATKVDDPCHAKYKNQTACDADTSTGGGCTWCKCAAVPSSCWTKENAKKLPAGVYTCDSLALTGKPLSPAAAAKPETHAELIHDLRTSVHHQTDTPITKAVLPASHSLATKVDDPCHAKYKNQTACDADTSTGGGCTWCKCAAVPSSCWTKENAKKLPAGVYTCDSSPAAIPSVQPSPISSAGTTDVEALIRDTSKMLSNVLSDSLGKLCAFGECCKSSSQDGCQVQMECVGTNVQVPSAATRANTLDSLADAAISCEADRALVATARKQASDETHALPTAACAASTCKQLHRCVVDMSSSAVMAMLISRSERNPSAVALEFETDLRNCATFDSSAMIAIRPGSVRALWSRHGSARAPDSGHTEASPQLAAAIGVATLCIIGAIIFSVVYRIERRKQRFLGHPLLKRAEAVHVW